MVNDSGSGAGPLVVIVSTTRLPGSVLTCRSVSCNGSAACTAIDHHKKGNAASAHQACRDLAGAAFILLLRL